MLTFPAKILGGGWGVMDWRNEGMLCGLQNHRDVNPLQAANTTYYIIYHVVFLAELTTQPNNKYNITTIRQYINTTIQKDNNMTKQQYNIATIQQYINMTIHKDDTTTKQQYNITAIQQHASSC
jgi:hypothetical protein